MMVLFLLTDEDKCVGRDLSIPPQSVVAKNSDSSDYIGRPTHFLAISAKIDLAVHNVNRNTEPCNLLRNDGVCLHDYTVIIEKHVLFLCAIRSTEDLYLHSGY